MSFCKALSNFTKRLESDRAIPRILTKWKQWRKRRRKSAWAHSSHPRFFPAWPRGGANGQNSARREGCPGGLVLAFSDADVHFKDFIEGVRLVMGEELLVGLPRRPWLAQDAPSRGKRSRGHHQLKNQQFFCRTPSHSHRSYEVGTTHLAAMTHLQQSNGLIIFGEESVIANPTYQHALMADIGPNAGYGRRMEFQIEHIDTRAKTNSLIKASRQSAFAATNLGIFQISAWERFANSRNFWKKELKQFCAARYRKNPETVAFMLLLLNGFGDLDAPKRIDKYRIPCPSRARTLPWLGWQWIRISFRKQRSLASHGTRHAPL